MEQLKRDLERLQREIDSMQGVDQERRAMLSELARSIEQAVDEETDGPDHKLLERARDVVAEFEVSHPKATAILNEILVALSGLGI